MNAVNINYRMLRCTSPKTINITLKIGQKEKPSVPALETPNGGVQVKKDLYRTLTPSCRMSINQLSQLNQESNPHSQHPLSRNSSNKSLQQSNPHQMLREKQIVMKPNDPKKRQSVKLKRASQLYTEQGEPIVQNQQSGVTQCITHRSNNSTQPLDKPSKIPSTMSIQSKEDANQNQSVSEIGEFIWAPQPGTDWTTTLTKTKRQLYQQIYQLDKKILGEQREEIGNHFHNDFQDDLPSDFQGKFNVMNLLRRKCEPSVECKRFKIKNADKSVEGRYKINILKAIEKNRCL